MSEQAPRPRLEEQIKDKFAGQSDADIIRQMNRAEAFGYDDESYELNRRLDRIGLTWRWSTRNKVLIYDPAEEEQP